MDKHRRKELKRQGKEIIKGMDYVLNDGGFPRTGLLMMQALEPGAESLSDPDYFALWFKQVFDAMFPSAERPPVLDVHSTDSEGDSVLHYACRWGDTRAVRLLLEAGANANASGDMALTPLHCAVNGRFADIAQILLSHGADAHPKDLFGYTPGEWADQMGFEEISSLFVWAALNPATTASLAEPIRLPGLPHPRTTPHTHIYMCAQPPPREPGPPLRSSACARGLKSRRSG